MKALGAVMLITMLCGCSSLARYTPGQPSTTTNRAQADAEAQKSQIIHAHQQTLSLAQLVLQRQELCQISAAERTRLLEDYRSIFIEGDVEPGLQTLLPKRRHQLNALMLSTCDPAKTPGVLREMLAVVTDEDEWPEEYMAFFDLLVASHRAYTILEDRKAKLATMHQNLQSDYESLQDDYQRLETEHENTIKGISEIERGIDIPAVDDHDR